MELLGAFAGFLLLMLAVIPVLIRRDRRSMQGYHPGENKEIHR